MTVLYIAMVLAGLSGIGFGFWGQGSFKSPYDTFAALCLPISLVIGLLGVLLLCVPNFFS